MKRKRATKCRDGRINLRFLPVIVWMAALGCVITLFYQKSQRFDVLGIAQGHVRQIATTCTGRIKFVSVRLFEKVTIGQTLAVIDTVLENEPYQAQLATIQAEIEHLTSQLTAVQDSYQAEETDRRLDYTSDKRRFAVDVENARLRILELTALLASDRILLGDLDMEFKISRQLLEEEVIEPYELEKARVYYESLSKKIEENERLLEQSKSDLERCIQRYDEYEQHTPYYPTADSSLEVVRKAVKVQEQLMNELLSRLQPLELKSPINGVVIPIQANANEVSLRRPGENVLRRPGEVVTAGEPLFAIAEIEPRDIVAWVNEGQLDLVREGTLVELIKNSEPALIARSQTTYVAPLVEQIPERLWRNPAIPQWGRPILIEIPPGLELVPGELVRIRGL
jgi:multidrug resistance efflux pump